MTRTEVPTSPDAPNPHGADVDCVIVGGGVIGSAIACFLSADPGFEGRVTVIEKDPSYRFGATSRSAGGIRHQFSTEANIAMSMFATEFVHSPGRFVPTTATAHDLGFVENGYLMLASKASERQLSGNVALQRRLGADVLLMGSGELSRRFPWMESRDVTAAALGVGGEGWIDPWALLSLFRDVAAAHGVRFVADEAVGFERHDGQIARVLLAAGDSLAGDVFVNAAGIAAADMCRLAGCEAPPVHPRKRYVFVFKCRTAIPRCPLVVDPAGVYFRPEGDRYICGLSPAVEDDPDCTDFEIDHDFFPGRIWPVLAGRVPAFEAIRLADAWAGHYAYNTFDQNAIIGRHLEVTNLVLANGFSGHGLQQAPAVGRAVAELITHGRYLGLDLSALSPRRIAAGRRVAESNVV